MQRKLIQRLLEYYVRRYLNRHSDVKLITVAGSVGKTSTKRAIATLLAKKYSVRFHDGNYNTHMSVPLTILDIEYPKNYKKLKAWLPVFAAARQSIKNRLQPEVIIVELGTVQPGNIAHFGTYLKPFISIVTSVTYEHMNAFSDLEAVAKEELGIASFSQGIIINRDDINPRFDHFLTKGKVASYGTAPSTDFRVKTSTYTKEGGFTVTMQIPQQKRPTKASVNIIGYHSLRPVMGAVAVATNLGLTPKEIKTGLQSFHPTPGRMNILKGKKDSLIIDDSYNASPLSTRAALQTLYELETPQRIAILGSMNELATASAVKHKEIGDYCDSSTLDWVVTVGDEAAKYLAPAAKTQGCQVKSFQTSPEAGKFVASKIKPGAVILVKGSQTNIYTEEAIKAFCKKSEYTKLVRQSEQWLKTKEVFFRS